MNTDASTVEDINVLLRNVCRCLALHLLNNGPISFAIDHSPFARMTVTPAKGSILWRCQSPYHRHWVNCCPPTGSPRSCCQRFTRVPLLRRPLVVNVPFWVVWWASAHHKSSRSWLLLIPRAQRYLTFRSVVSQAFRCSRGKHVRIPHAGSWDQIHHRLWFCCDSFFTCIFLCSFRHRFKTTNGTEMTDIEHIQQMIQFITCELFLWLECRQVGFLVLMYLISILGSKLIRSNNQSSATLWVLETCLIVGLLPFMIIVITASLSSKIYNKASLRE